MSDRHHPRRSPPLFTYRKASAAHRTLAALRAAQPHVDFTIVPGRDWCYHILATLPSGSSGLVAKRPHKQFVTLPD